MGKNNAKLILRKFRFCYFGCVNTALIVVILILFLTKNAFLFFAAALLLLFFRRIIGVYFFNKYINSIMSKDLNPVMYNAVFEAGKIVSNHLFEKIEFSYYSGDYQTVINICSAKLKDTKLKKYQYWYMWFLARSYFELGDFENLRLIYNRFQTMTEADAKCEQLRNKYIYFKFIGLYLKGEFAECKALYEGLVCNTQPHNSKTLKLYDIQIKFTYAISCYKSQDLDTATKVFNYIIAEAPRLHFAVISQKYLNAIEAGIEYQPEYSAVSVDENFILPKPRKSTKIRKTIRLILMVLCFICLYLGVMLMQDEPVHFKGLDYSTMRSDIQELYGEPDEIKEFIYPAGEFYDVYKAEFLGIKGDLEFRYFDGGDDLFCAQFIIDSKDFESYAEYEKAVNKTYKYFNRVLSGYQIWDRSDDEGINISWEKSANKYAYSVYNTQTSDTGFTDDFRDCTIFQFNKYPKIN
ncbi:MAG: hypothetical protein IJD09_01590 [Clostridia bacterium]|nr:hypothetical protein [Clostridia bacterium]